PDGETADRAARWQAARRPTRGQGAGPPRRTRPARASGAATPTARAQREEDRLLSLRRRRPAWLQVQCGREHYVQRPWLPQRDSNPCSSRAALFASVVADLRDV